MKSQADLDEIADMRRESRRAPLYSCSDRMCGAEDCQSCHPCHGTTDDERKEDPETGEGGPCPKDGCPGTLQLIPIRNCSCHISPPCPEHSEPQGLECSDCTWSTQ